MVFDHTAPAYVAFWQRTLDKARRLILQPPNPSTTTTTATTTATAPPLTVDDLAPSVHDVRELGGLPNFELFAQFVASANIATALVFVFALAPFALVCADERLLAAAETTTGIGVTRRTVWAMPNTDRSTAAVQYRSLVLRVTYLSYIVDLLHRRASDTSVAHAAEHCRRLETAATLWRNGHIMLMLAIEELGYVPANDVVWTQLLARFAPDVNTFFHVGEMPDATDSLHATPILKKPTAEQAAQNKMRAANLICLLFTKVCPRRCSMRDLIEIMLDYAVRNVASLHMIMLLLAASYLGVYAHCTRRPDFATTRDVYRLFFFELGADLGRYRRTTGNRASEAERLRQRYAMHASDVHIYSNKGNPRVRLPNYTTALCKQYRAVAEKADKAAGDTAAGGGGSSGSGGGAKSKAKKARFAAGATGKSLSSSLSSSSSTASDGSRTTARQRAEAVVPTMATTEQRPDGSYAIVIDDDETELCRAVALTNATARLETDRAHGREYYDYRRAAGTLPIINGEPQEFVSSDTNVTDVYAYRRIAPCDERLPSAVDMARREIVFGFLGTLIEYDNQRPPDPNKPQPPSKEYAFSGTVTQQIRDFMMELLARDKPLHDELCVRVQWRSWQQSVVASTDLLRTRVTEAAANDEHGRPFLRQHVAHYRVSNENNAPTNNLYRTENASFISQLNKQMAAVVVSPHFQGLPVDKVKHDEIDTMIGQCLRFYRYPRCYAESSVVVEHDDLVSTTVTGGGGTGTEDDASSRIDTTSAPFIETITPALAPFGYMLSQDELPPDATVEWIRENIAQQLLFPGREFHMSTETIARYSAVYKAYIATDDNDKMLGVFARSLANTSVFQFMLLYAFVREVDAYLSIYTVPLPKHIVDQQLRVLVDRYGTGDASRLPPHIHYSLVCLSCRRYAGFLASIKRPNIAYAVGTNDVRTLDISYDQIVIDRVRRRGRLLATDELTGAPSMYDVFDTRAMYASDVYDQYTIDPIDAQIEEQRRANGYYTGTSPFNPWSEPTPTEKYDNVLRLYASALEREAELRADETELADWRTSDPIYALDARGKRCDSLPRGASLPPMHPVAVDGTVASELAFHRRVRDVFDRLMGGNFFLMGHRIPNEGNRPYLAATDTRRPIRHELKKRKAQIAERHALAHITNEAELIEKEDKLRRRCCRSVYTLMSRMQCSTKLMWEFCRLGNALVVGQRGRQKTTEVFIDCCGCATSTQFSALVPRGAFYFCPTCIANGSWSAWVNAPTAPGNSDVGGGGSRGEQASRDVDLSLTVRLATPNRSWLPDQCVRQGEKCVHPKCRRSKAPGTQMIAKEVIFDSHGKEHIGYVAICPMHYKRFPWITTLPVMLTYSMLNVLLSDDTKTSVTLDEIATTDFLQIYTNDRNELAQNTSSSSSSRHRGKTRGRTLLEALEADEINAR